MFICIKYIMTQIIYTIRLQILYTIRLYILDSWLPFKFYIDDNKLLNYPSNFILKIKKIVFNENCTMT